MERIWRGMDGALWREVERGIWRGIKILTLGSKRDHTRDREKSYPFPPTFHSSQFPPYSSSHAHSIPFHSLSIAFCQFSHVFPLLYPPFPYYRSHSHPISYAPLRSLSIPPNTPVISISIHPFISSHMIFSYSHILPAYS